jgi:CRP-like cAMP-binding protein
LLAVAPQDHQRGLSVRWRAGRRAMRLPNSRAPRAAIYSQPLPSALRRHGEHGSPPEKVTIATQFRTKKQGSGTRKVANFRWNESKFHVKQPPRVAARLPVTEFVLPPANLAINDESKEALMGKPAKRAFDAQVFLAKMGEGKSILQFQKGQDVFVQGDRADTVFYIQKGRIKLTVLSDHGKEAVVGIIEPGQFLIDQLFNSSEKRLARLLLLLANFGKEGSPQPISLSISQETLAEMIGTTRSRVSFFMNKFRKLGLIDYNGHIEVHNSLLNAVLRDKPQLRLDESDPSVS